MYNEAWGITSFITVSLNWKKFFFISLDCLSWANYIWITDWFHLERKNFAKSMECKRNRTSVVGMSSISIHNPQCIVDLSAEPCPAVRWNIMRKSSEIRVLLWVLFASIPQCSILSIKTPLSSWVWQYQALSPVLFGWGIDHSMIYLSIKLQKSYMGIIKYQGITRC